MDLADAMLLNLGRHSKVVFYSFISISIWFTACENDGCLCKNIFLSEEMYTLNAGSTY